MGKKWNTSTAGLIFLGALSVYPDRAVQAVAADKSDGAESPAAITSKSTKFDASSDVKIVDDQNDPFNASATATTTSSSASTQPSEGKSVSSQEVNVSDAGTVEIHVNEANLVEALRMLSLQSEKNIIASKDVKGTVTANLYDVTVREALDAILHANGYAYREKGNFIHVYTTRELQDIEKSEKQVKTEVFPLYYTPAANAAVMIKPVLSPAGQVAMSAAAQNGISGSSTDTSSGSSGSASGNGGNEHALQDMLVITDYPDNLEAVRHVLAEIDRRPQQILLEATILRAALSEDNSLGIDFTVLGGVDFAGLNTAGTSSADLLSGAITNQAGTGTAGAPTPNSIVHNGASAAGTGFTQGLPTGGLRVGVVTSNVAAFLQALEQTTDTTVLANPKILTLNKQQGEVFVGNEDGYYTTVTTETTTSQEVDTLKTGTRLLFRPYIARDGFIRLEVHPEDSDGEVKANGLPSKTTSEVTSNIMVKDGHTIVIGGLFRESTTTIRNQVPFLGNIPLAGWLFKSQHDTTARDEVIILLTPHIVKDEVAYSDTAQEQMKHIEDLRVGVRKGLMPWGRERLAESAYENAKRELAKPHPDRTMAVWDLNEATNLNPTFGEAIELKEQLTGKIVTDESGQLFRKFITEVIVRDLPPATQPTTEPTSRPSTAAVNKTNSKAANIQAASIQTTSIQTTSIQTLKTQTANPQTTDAETSDVESSDVETDEDTRVDVADAQPANVPQPVRVLASHEDADAESGEESPTEMLTVAPATQPAVVKVPANSGTSRETLQQLDEEAGVDQD